MISGMTGYGTSDMGLGRVKGTVEIKTVNHRYLDPAYYLPSGFSSYEDKVQKIIARHLKRGRVTISIRITEKPQMTITVNKEAVKKYADIAKALAKELNLKNDFSTADLLKMPGVVEAKETYVQAVDIWPVAEKAIEKALVAVVAMRKREGRSLASDINGQLKKMTTRISQIKTRASNLLKEQKVKLTSEEYASYQKSNDINEELSRLAHHISEAKNLLKTSNGAGKQLDFIAQEMQRETNTIGSKVQDNQISAAVIALKAKVEKIREQANNVE
ncbi:MAG: YicC family protein [Candidatus Omnitrophica bacterium]|nr:YicC family protein [Candidatus Omnitrophota bacterium]